jgi:hypothetical protein
MGKSVMIVLMMLFLGGCGMKHCSRPTTGCEAEKPEAECGGFGGADFRCDNSWLPRGD